MRRRTLIQTLVAWMSVFRPRLLLAQPAAFPGRHESTLKELASTLLPESLSPTGTDAIAQQFKRWVQEYLPGAEMQTGYGTTRVRYKAASPEFRYVEQLDRLAAGALAQTSLADRRRTNAAAKHCGLRWAGQKLSEPNVPRGSGTTASGAS